MTHEEKTKDYVERINFNVQILANFIRQTQVVDAYWKVNGILDQILHLKNHLNSPDETEAIPECQSSSS